MDRDDEYHLALIRKLLETYPLEDIIEQWTYLEVEELLLQMYQQGDFHTKLKDIPMELGFEYPK